MLQPLIAVHAGAGYHSEDKKKSYKSACMMACTRAMKQLKAGESGLVAVTEAVLSLENSPMTNAGVGSSLTVLGEVECDATVMDGESLLAGSVGALTGIKNPVCVALKILQQQKLGKLSLGRLPPSFLVGRGASQWAVEHGFESTPQSTMITETSMRFFEKHKKKLVTSERRMRRKREKRDDPGNNKKLKGDDENTRTSVVCVGPSTVQRVTDDKEASTPNTHRHGDQLVSDQPISDTVGAVCIDGYGHMSSAVSSGGIPLKHSGRIGPAAVCGSGCWAYDCKGEDRPGVAIAVSGSGEDLMRTHFARECAQSVVTWDSASRGVSQAFTDKFLTSEFLWDAKERLAGVLVLRQDRLEEKRNVEIVWSHSTSSMCVGYMLGNDSRAKALISRLPETGVAGYSLAMEGKQFTL
ncbi:hypothetical protein ScPMuIL_013877 [Solemya velum]